MTRPEENAQNAVLAVSTELAKVYNMEPAAFAQTVYETCCERGITRAELAAGLMVAKHHNLNPLTREIYFFKKKGGGIVPIVSVDGWISLVNSHPQFDGMEFLEIRKKGELESTTCRLYRKDRSRPVEVTEYLKECKRNTDPWNTMPHRMLRHKALIQCARYTFGFAGIYDEEEGRVIAEAIDITPERPPAPPAPPPEIFVGMAPPPTKESGPTIDAVQGSSHREAEDQGDSVPPGPAASAFPELPAHLDRRNGKVEDAELVDEPQGMTPDELAAYLDEQGIKAPSEVSL